MQHQIQPCHLQSLSLAREPNSGLRPYGGPIDFAKSSLTRCACTSDQRMGARHPCWPPIKSQQVECRLAPFGNPRFNQPDRAPAYRTLVAVVARSGREGDSRPPAFHQKIRLWFKKPAIGRRASSRDPRALSKRGARLLSSSSRLDGRQDGRSAGRRKRLARASSRRLRYRAIRADALSEDIPISDMAEAAKTNNFTLVCMAIPLSKDGKQGSQPRKVPRRMRDCRLNP